MGLWNVARSFSITTLLSEECDHLLVSCTLLCHQRAVGWRCSSWKVVALLRDVEPSLFSGLLRSLYLWLLILSIHTYVATLNSTVLIFQKIATCWQVGLVWGHQYHQNGCSDSMLGDFLVAFWTRRLGTLKASCIPTSAAWFIPQCYVPWNVSYFTFLGRKISVTEVPNYPSPRDLKIVLSVLKFCTKFSMNFTFGKC